MRAAIKIIWCLQDDVDDPASFWGISPQNHDSFAKAAPFPGKNHNHNLFGFPVIPVRVTFNYARSLGIWLISQPRDGTSKESLVGIGTREERERECT